MKKLSKLVSAVALILGMSAYATTFEMTGKGGKMAVTPTGTTWDLWDSSLYGETGFPGKPGDQWQIAGYAAGERNFSLSKNLETNSFNAIDVKTGHAAAYTAAGSTLNMDFGENEIYMTARGDSDPLYSAPMFKFVTYMPKNDNYPEYNGSPDIVHISLTRDAKSRVAPFRLSQLSLTQKTVDNHATYDFKAGTFNAFDPAGTGTQESNQSAAYKLSIWNNNANYMGFDVFFREGFNLRMPNINIECAGTDATKTHVAMEGANVFVGNSFTMQGGYLDITNGTTVTIGGKLTTSNTKSHTKVTGEGTAVTAASYESSGDLKVEQKASVAITGAATCSSGSTLTVDDASFTAGGVFATTENSTVIITNGVAFSAQKICNSYGTLKIYDTPVTLTDASSKMIEFYGSTLISGSKTVIDASTGGTLGVANPGVTITEGATVKAAATYFSGEQSHLIIGKDATCTVAIADELSTTGAYNCKYILVDGGSYTGLNALMGTQVRLQVNSGTMYFNGVEGIKIMEGGGSDVAETPTEVIVNGGKLKTCRIRPVRLTSHPQETTAKGISNIEINGGEVELTDDSGIHYFQNTFDTENGYTNPNPQYLKIRNGGTLYANRISQGPRTTGTIHFLADGGIFKARTETTSGNPAIMAMADARIGDNGFIIDTQDYSTFINGDYLAATNGAGEVCATNARFIKRGTGSLYLTPGENWGVGAEIQAGTLNYCTCPSAGVGDVTIGENGTLSLTTVGTLTVNNLTINGGTISLNPGNKIIVKGTTTITGLKLNWGTAPTIPTTFLETEGEISEASIAALNEATYASLPEGKKAAFTAEYDSDTGKSVIVSSLVDSMWQTDASAYQVTKYSEGTRDYTVPATLDSRYLRLAFVTGGEAGYTDTGDTLNVTNGENDVIQARTIEFGTYYPLASGKAYSANSPVVAHVQLARTDSTTAAAFKLSDFGYSQSTTNAITTYDFKYGTFNAYDASGEAVGADSSVFTLCNYGDSFPMFSAYFRPDFTLRVAGIQIGDEGSNANNTFVNFNGATVQDFGAFTQKGGTTVFDNGASVTIAGDLKTADGSVLIVTNCAGFAVNNIPSYGCYGTVKVYNTPLTLTADSKNGYFWGSTLLSGALTDLKITGGTFSVNNAGVTVTDGAKVSAKSIGFQNGQSYLVVGKDGNVTIEGRLTLETARSYNRKYVQVDGGYFEALDAYPNDQSRLVLNSGTMYFKGGEGIKMAEGGGYNNEYPSTAEIIVNGGYLYALRIRPVRLTSVAQQTNAKVTTIIEINGGEVELKETSGIYYFQNSQAVEYTYPLDQYLKLRNGGMLHAWRISQGNLENKCETHGTIHFLADGGIFKAKGSTTQTLPSIMAMADARIGDNGFIIDTQENSVFVNGDYLAATNGAGEVIATNARFIKRGSGSLYLTPGENWGVGAEIQAGTLNYRTCPSAGVGNVTIGSDGTLSLTTVGTLTVNNLTIDGGTISLNQGDKIIVNGNVSVSNLKLNWTEVPESDAIAFLEVNGALDEDTATSIRKAVYANSIASGKHASISAVYDAETGKTTFKATIADDAPITDLVVWQGAENGNWSTASNWEGEALPTKAQKAAFTNETAGRVVNVDAAQEVGALTFANTGYELNGNNNVYISAETGVAQLEVTEGSHVINAPIKLFDEVSVPVNTNATLTVKKSITNGKFKKSGIGKLVLEAANQLEKGVSSADGIIEVKNEDAFGANGDAQGEFMLGGGTAVFSGEEPLHIADKVTVRTPGLNDYAAFKVDVDTELDYLRVESGSFLKRGTGKLTINIPADTEYQVGAEGGTYYRGGWSANKPGISFPADGTTPLTGNVDKNGVCYRYPGFGIYEGELVLKGAGDGAKATIKPKTTDDSLGAGSIGLVSADCAKDPVLTVDNVEFDTGKGFLIGDNTGDTGRSPKTVTVNLINNALMRIRNTQIGYASGNNGVRININATNSTFTLDTTAHLTRAYGNSDAWVEYNFKNSDLLINGSGTSLQIGGKIMADFDGGHFGREDGGAMTLTSEDNRPFGEIYLHNGAILSMISFTEATNDKNLNFIFDNAEWQLCRDRTTTAYAASTTGFVKYWMQGAGATFKPVKDAIYTMNAKLEGNGGLTVDGEGTLKIADGALLFTGSPLVLKGTLDANGQTVNNPKVMYTSEVTPVFKNCEVAGRLIVDCNGATPEIGAQQLVAQFTDIVPASLKVSLVNCGVKRSATAAIDAEGKVTITVAAPASAYLFFR